MDMSKHGDTGGTKVLVFGTEGAAGVMSALRLIRGQWTGDGFQFVEGVLRGSGAALATEFNSLLRQHRPDLLLLCLRGESPGETERMLQDILRQRLETTLILALENPGDHATAGWLDARVADFVVAPFRECDLLPRLRRLRRTDGNERAGETAARELKARLGLEQLIGESPELLAVIRQIPKFVGCDATVLLNGETGTGKEMFARAIHYLSSRAANPFIPVNCGAIPADLVENELFGHEPGAFTGAAAAASGLIAEAEGGTLFLDEIDTLPLVTQVKLLRFLQDHVYRPLGARKLCGANIRVVAASNAKLESAVRAGKFRADLFYRINVLSLSLPPLRERRQDIPLLARHFTSECAREMKLPAREISPAAMQKLMSYHWPGNVRELQNMVQRAVVLVDDNVIRPMDFDLPGEAAMLEAKSFKALKARVVEDFERSYLQQLLTAHDGNITQAARAADKNRRALWELLRKYQIQLPPPVASGRTPVDKLAQP